MSAAISERKLYKLVAVSFGLLCIIQAALNISMRLILYKNTEASFKTLTEERDKLERKLFDFDTKGSSKLEMELIQLQTRYKNLTEEKDLLLTDYKNLIEEQDQLQKNLEDMTKNRNDLQRKLQSLLSQRYVYFGGSLYYISSEEKSWQQSRDDCLKRGADLIIINNHEEQTFTRIYKKRIWIGLTDRETEGEWKWVDGTPLTMKYWSPSEPNNGLGADEDCAEIKRYDMEMNWNDEPCNLNKFWICEKTLPQ